MMKLVIIGWILVILGIIIKVLPKIAKYFYVQVPEIAGGVVISKISGRTGRILKEGLHLILPWHYVKVISLERRTSREIIIDSIPTKNGGVITYKCSYQFKPCINHLGRFIENDESLIQKGIEDMIKSFIGQFSANYTVDQLLKKWGELEKFVCDKFKEEYEAYDEILKKNVKYTELEHKYGVEIIRLSLTDIDLPKELQEQREKALKERYFEEGEKKRWQNTIKRIKKSFPNISDEKALNAIQVERDKIKKHVIEIEGLNLNEIARNINQTISKTINEILNGGKK